MITMQQVLYSDSISILDFALVLEQYNPEIGNFVFFSNIIYDAIEAGKLTPLSLPNNYSIPFRERDFKFAPVILIKWAKNKKFKIEQSFGSNEIKWLSAPHYKQEWQAATNGYKKQNQRLKKTEVANAIYNDYINKYTNFPFSAETIARNISIKATKK